MLHQEVLKAQANFYPYLDGLVQKARAAVPEGKAVQFVVSQSEWELLRELGIEDSGPRGLAATVEALAFAGRYGIAIRRLSRRSLWARLLVRLREWRSTPAA